VHNVEKRSAAIHLGTETSYRHPKNNNSDETDRQAQAKERRGAGGGAEFAVDDGPGNHSWLFLLDAMRDEMFLQLMSGRGGKAQAIVLHRYLGVTSEPNVNTDPISGETRCCYRH